MTLEDRRTREQAARRQLIITTARALAEAEGWEAVTTRRLATEIEYSQPVIYKHFAGMDQIAAAIAVEGFGELADAIRTARSSPDPLNRIAHAYVDFARHNPAVYDVMFTRVTTLHFAAPDTPPELTAAFTELREAVAVAAHGQDTDALTEVVWAALHGLVVLSRAGRLRPGYESDRIQLLVAQFTRG
ncbi:TetR/AcrR family transcriptional regulator [Mycolicibacterium litorale]|uniref:TetR/AcrR family transcriptional regulator n=1 Tax=Mycolicibacterium litorale TaxID=758802 RepID=UPI003CF9845B